MKKILFVLLRCYSISVFSQDKKNIIRIGIATQTELKIPKKEIMQFGPQTGYGPLLSYIRKLTPKINLAIGTRYYYYSKSKAFQLEENNILKNYNEKHAVLFNYLGIAQKVADFQNGNSIWIEGRIGTGTTFMNWTSSYPELNKSFNTTKFAWGIDCSYFYFKNNNLGISYLKMGKADFILFMLVHDFQF